MRNPHRSLRSRLPEDSLVCFARKMRTPGKKKAKGTDVKNGKKL
jgi:hypothetical protein